MRRVYIFLAFLIGIGGVACSQENQYKMSIDEFREGILQDSVLLIDVRTAEEFETARIPGAVNIDVKSDSFTVEADSIDRSMTVLLYCRSGKRSDRAAQEMTDLGFSKVYDLQGGILGWNEKGYQVDSTSLNVTH